MCLNLYLNNMTYLASTLLVVKQEYAQEHTLCKIQDFIQTWVKYFTRWIFYLFMVALYTLKSAAIIK